MGGLMGLEIGEQAEKGLDLTQENSIAKVYLAHMVHKVIDTAIQLHGALGFSQDTILAKWYTQVRSQRLVDGPDEVHKWKVGRNVIKAFREHTWVYHFRSEEHTSELQSHLNLVCRLLLEKKKSQNFLSNAYL